MVAVRLRPKSTRVFQNEQLVRLKPNAASSVPGAGLSAEVLLGPNQTRLEETVTRVRLLGKLPNAVPAVSSDTNEHAGEALVNGSFTLQGGATPNVPVTYALLFQDPNANVTAGDVTINYTDDTDTGRQDNFDIIMDGLGPHYTSFPVKSIQSIVGANFVGHQATDTLLVGPAVPDTVHDVVGTSGTAASVPQPDPNGGSSDGDASYVMSNSTSDQRTYVGFPNIDGTGGDGKDLRVISITSLTITWFGKNIGATAAGGIECIFRLGDGDTDWLIGAITATGSETSTLSQLSSSAMTVNPKTGLGWTVDDINNLQVGVRFKGDSPAVEKRWAFVRVNVLFRQGFVHPTIDGRDVNNVSEIWRAVAKHPFGTPSDDATQYIVNIPSSGSQILRLDFEDLPAEANEVLSVTEQARWTYLWHGEQNGVPPNDTPCKVGTQDQYGTQLLNRLDGPLEQSNIGGIRMSGSIGGSQTGDRILLGAGDPPSGCGNFGTQAGLDRPFGEFQETQFVITQDTGMNPLSVADVNGMELGVSMENSDLAEYRLSRVFAQVEYRRGPTGGTYFHLVVDDLPDSPDDSDYMPSQHASNKEFGVDFAGIPEVTQINTVSIIVRARSSAGATTGWRVKWRLAGQSDVLESIENNVGFGNFTYSRSTSPFTGLPWTREEVNGLIIIWESQGENDYFEKAISSIILEVDFDAIPEKIDAARNIASRKLRLLRKPKPLLTLGLPPKFADLKMLKDLQVIHNAIPRTAETLGFEIWDRSLFRLMRKKIRAMEDRVDDTLLDLREYLTTMWITGSTRTKGTTTDGMAVLTPGIAPLFARATNDYFQDPFAGLIQELNSDEPPSNQKGLLVLNGATNRVVNSGFSEGAPNVFTDWTQSIGAGGAITEDLTDNVFEEDVQGNAPRTVVLTTPSTPADGTVVNQIMNVPSGDTLSPEGSDYALTIGHRDPSGQPLSVSVEIDPPGFSARQFDFEEGLWVATGTPIWETLPVRSSFAIDRIIGSLQNMEDIPSSPFSAELPLNVRIGNRTLAGAENRLYTVNLEGGTILSGESARYPTNFILTRNGPVVRNGMAISIQNERARPVYPADLRGTFTVEVEPIWDSAELPRAAGVRRYVFGWVVDAFNEESLYYDSDTESFVYLRKIAGVSLTSTVFFPNVRAGCAIQLATRWISSVGDLGETPFSATLFVNGKQGGTFVHSQKFPMPLSEPFYIGSRDGTDGEMFDGYFRKLECKQLALPVAAINRIFS